MPNNERFRANHDPQSNVDYTIDWSLVLTASSPIDTISTSAWRVEGDDAMSLGAAGESGSNVSTFVTGGTAGGVAKLINTITTAGGRTHERTIYLTVKQL